MTHFKIYFNELLSWLIILKVYLQNRIVDIGLVWFIGQVWFFWPELFVFVINGVA